MAKIAFLNPDTWLPDESFFPGSERASQYDNVDGNGFGAVVPPTTDMEFHISVESADFIDGFTNHVVPENDLASWAVYGGATWQQYVNDADAGNAADAWSVLTGPLIIRASATIDGAPSENRLVIVVTDADGSGYYEHTSFSEPNDGLALFWRDFRRSVEGQVTL